MGLVMGSDGQYKILSDIMGMEDHLGDMDFKVAGTAKGINALQMDIKIKGLSIGLLREALLQAREGRLFILEKMAQVLQGPRPELSEYTPRIETIKILPSKIGGLIGPGGKNIKKIIELSGADVDIEDDGTVFVSSSNPESMERAKKMIEDSTAEVEVGKIYTGKVVRIQKFGAFVQLLPGKDGLVHISELADHHVEQVEDVVKEGDEVQVKVLDIDNQGRVSLTCQLHKEPGQHRRPQRSTTRRPQRPRGYHDKQ
jgi:polyribonucleotide nucleotidyltransferase